MSAEPIPTPGPMPPAHEREGVPLATRRRLARSELLVHLAVSAERWKRELRDEDGGRPFAQWPEDDPLRALCATYDLTPEQLAEVADGVGDRLEAMAEHIGYGEHWDPLVAWLVCDTGREHVFRPPDAARSRCGRAARPGEHRASRATLPRCAACTALELPITDSTTTV